MGGVNEAPRSTRWFKALELPREVYAAWRKPDRALSPVAVVATVDADGAPRAAPFGSLRAVSPSVLRFAPCHQQATYANIVRDGRVNVALIAAPDIAVSVRGRARVIREHMSTDENRAVVEIKIEEVRNAMVPTLTIDNGITITAREGFRNRFVAAIRELEAMP